MSKNNFSLHSTFSINNEFSENDTRFLHVTIDVLHTGKNLNGSFFTKEVVDSCIESIKNIPILGFIKRDRFLDEDDFAGHEYKLVRTSDGVEEVYCGSCYGVVPESCNPRWIVKVSDDGQEREYLQVDALMWEKFSDATNIVYRDVEKSQSMEIEINSVKGHDENGVFYFDSLRFEGLCILGDQVQPAMVGANVKINDGVNFTMSDIANSVRSELNDKLELFNVAFAKFTNNETCDNQGGAKNMLDTDLNQVEEIVLESDVVEETEVEFEVTVETEIETTEDAVFEAAEETDEAAEEIESESEVESEVDEEAEVVEEVPAEEDAVEFEVNESDEIVETVIEESKFSEMQAEMESLKTDYAKVQANLEEMTSMYENVKSEYEAIKSEYDEIKPKYDEYVRVEAQREADELNARKDAVFAEYESDLSDNAEFAALKEKKDGMSLEDIERECAFLYVKVNRAKNKFSAADSQSAVVGVMNDSDSSNDDGFVLTARYGYIPVNR